jgi:transcriptional regulator with XRE-family HTH domain
MQRGIELPGGTFASNLIALRQAQGWSRQELADRAGINHSAIHRLEKGERQPSLPTILKLASALGTTGSEAILGI